MTDVMTLQDEEVLNQLFDSVDIRLTGFVSSNSLVAAVESTWANASECASERAVKLHVQDLVRRLDDRNDNGYVSREVFVKCGLGWLENVRKTSTITASLSSSSSLSLPNSSQTEIIGNVQPCGHALHNKNLILYLPYRGKTSQ